MSLFDFSFHDHVKGIVIYKSLKFWKSSFNFAKNFRNCNFDLLVHKSSPRNGNLRFVRDLSLSTTVKYFFGPRYPLLIINATCNVTKTACQLPATSMNVCTFHVVLTSCLESYVEIVYRTCIGYFLLCIHVCARNDCCNMGGNKFTFCENLFKETCCGPLLTKRNV